jgi:hypothetical protein
MTPDAAHIRLGLILDPEFVLLQRSVVATTPSLIRGLCRAFDTRIIHDQATFDARSPEVDVLVSLEPGWAAPVLDWRRDQRRHLAPPAYVMMSDPHQGAWRQEYVRDQGIEHVLALYWAPTLRHFAADLHPRLVHFPWTVPDRWFSDAPVRWRGSATLTVFGAADDPAYELRNWCRTQPGVESSLASGVENRVYEEQDYFDWLQGFDAVVVAGSEAAAYRLTTPKFFEAAAAGCLVFAQHTDDLERLGFVDGVHCLTFTRDTFAAVTRPYLEDPSHPRWTTIRDAGRRLVRERHSLSRRLADLAAHMHQARQARAARPGSTHRSDGCG